MSKKLQRLLSRFEAASRAHSWRGGNDPEDLPQIDREYQTAKRKLIAHLEVLEELSQPLYQGSKQ